MNREVSVRKSKYRTTGNINPEMLDRYRNSRQNDRLEIQAGGGTGGGQAEVGEPFPDPQGMLCLKLFMMLEVSLNLLIIFLAF